MLKALYGQKKVIYGIVKHVSVLQNPDVYMHVFIH